MKRSFLFLQGVCSPFFSELAAALRQSGSAVARINFTSGDNAFWKGRDAVSFRRPLDQLAPFIQSIFDERSITDVLVFGDTRPVHIPAIDLAKRLGIKVHVFEEGYFRPYWVTLERGGVNGYSSLPKDPQWYLDMRNSVAQYGNGNAFSSSFFARAWHDLRYNSLGISNPVFYRNYRNHAPVSPFKEYAYYIRRGAKISLSKKKYVNNVNELLVSGRPFYFIPLQLNSDSQIRVHSEFSNMREMLALTMRSFALHAPQDSLLVIKNHPLDAGVVNHAAIVRQLTKDFFLTGRVIYLEDGSLPDLLRNTRGVVTINSTVGGSALVHMCPTIALGKAIFNIKGLTFQGELDRFWLDGTRPDGRLLDAFRNVVIHTTQINGGFYTKDGIGMAVDGALPRILGERSPLESLL
ncbi:capsule biosynthesis protein [Schauerella aestuarii]|uniref:capsule biosynthesis protein n=1 Tax=Schauerella aestuarii TaxID=2511204 RepID=UPI00136B200C|nr:capsular biosynthesis protein [Achromobacter aestuarii]MYZ45495.1 capsular biosynthesis protein [Achromobacter aestuarii]